MGELRRLLIAPERLYPHQSAGHLIDLTSDEAHYLKRVLRRRVGDALGVTDGCGRLWQAHLRSGNTLELSSDRTAFESCPNPRLGLALALTRRGFDEVTRMACELGIDAIQPLSCARCTPQAEHRPERWSTIIRVSVEQCERLWMPRLDPLSPINTWSKTTASVAVGVTRDADTPPLRQWLEPLQASEAWVVVGPEGGWDEEEMELFARRGWQSVQLGASILRSSTAAVRAAVELVQWREQSVLNG